jgi:predicted ArsR family transcriptional regulator
MEFIKISAYIEQLDRLIRNERTGSASEFSKRLGISERTLRNHLQQIRELGAEVIYDRYKRTYKYSQKGRLTLTFNREDKN